MFTTIAVYLVLKYAKENQGSHILALAGLSLGLAALIEYMASLFVFVLTAYLLFINRRRGLLPFLLIFLIGPAIHLIYNYSIFSDPFFFPEQLQTGTVSKELTGQFSLAWIPEHALFFMLSPYRGLLLFSPVLILAIYQLYRMMRTDRYRVDSFLFITLFLIILLSYSAWYKWDGGLGYGQRFLILGLPFLTIPIAIFLSENKSGAARIAFLSLFGFSSFIQGAGALTSAFSTYGSILTYQPLAHNIPLLLQGKLDTWWLARLQITDLSFIRFFVATVFLCIWSIVAYLTITEYRTENVDKKKQEPN
jgi:hypothetical protein